MRKMVPMGVFVGVFLMATLILAENERNKKELMVTNSLNIDKLLGKLLFEIVDVDFSSKTIKPSEALWGLVTQRESLMESFTWVTSQDWPEKSKRFQEKLISKVAAKGYDIFSLQKCFDAMRSDKRNRDKSIIPVAVFRAKQAGINVWIIVCVWEYMRQDIKGANRLMHIRLFAFREDNQENIAFETCD